jgi:hypothetical protein
MQIKAFRATPRPETDPGAAYSEMASSSGSLNDFFSDCRIFQSQYWKSGADIFSWY